MQREFSLVLATIGRYQEVEAFLRSLENQTYRAFSVILVDQNADAALLAPLIERSPLKILRITSPKGLSRARNAGLSHCHGDVVCFPDDDCQFPPDLLERANLAYERTGADVLVGRQLDMHDNNGSVPPTQTGQLLMRFLRRGKSEESLESLCWNAPSSVLFFSRKAVACTGSFDESMGVGGTPWGSGEETDYLIRACLQGCVCVRCLDLCVHHPSVDLGHLCHSKARAYGRGRSYLIRKHRLGRIFALLNIIFPLLKAVYFLPHIEIARYYLYLAWGRLEGYFLPADTGHQQ